MDGYIITNSKGDVIKTTYKGDKKTEGEKILANIPELVEKAKIGVKNVNANVSPRLALTGRMSCSSCASKPS